MDLTKRHILRVFHAIATGPGTERWCNGVHTDMRGLRVLENRVPSHAPIALILSETTHSHAMKRCPRAANHAEEVEFAILGHRASQSEASIWRDNREPLEELEGTKTGTEEAANSQEEKRTNSEEGLKKRSRNF
jgi:hypothetical protein